MKTSLISLLLIFVLTGFSSVFAQKFQPPAAGKAVVYFARVSSYGGGAAFEYFHNNKYIGVAKGAGYIRYECDPGEQLLWVSTENKEFVTADLKAGGTYIVIVDVRMGAWTAQVGLTPISVTDKELFDRAKKLINKKKPIVTKQEQIDKMNKKLEKFISEKLTTYNEKWKKEKNFKHISADMAIPVEELK